MISVALPQKSRPQLRMMPPGRATARSGSVAARAEVLFDQTFIDLANSRVSGGLLDLLRGLADIHARADRRQWRRVANELWPRHPVSTQFRDPEIRVAVMRVGGPSSGLAALLSLLGEPRPR